MGRCLEKYKKDKDLVVLLAGKLAGILETDVRVYTKQSASGLIYDFEPVLVNEHADKEIMIIAFNHDDKE